jgi:probable HAF family extracellular repeat protein
MMISESGHTTHSRHVENPCLGFLFRCYSDPGDDSSRAFDINDAGQVVGYGSAATGNRAFLWDAVNGMQNLGDLPGGSDRSFAFGINNAGQVVGDSSAATGRRAFLWDAVNGMQDLNDLIDPGLSAVLFEAAAINASGQIVGRSVIDGYAQAFLLTPCPTCSFGPSVPPSNVPASPSNVPVPATLVLMLGGIGALAGVARHRKAATPQA